MKGEIRKMKTLKEATLKEIENLCLKARYQGLESDDFFLSAFIPDEEVFIK
jgi:hypothetical protein